MKIFVDTANLDEIKAALDTGMVDGVTTNPSLLAKEPKSKFEEHIEKIIGLLRGYNIHLLQSVPLHLSVEVFSKNPDEISKQARYFKETFGYPGLSVKVQIGWNELKIIKDLEEDGIAVNCTACMTVSQALMAAKANASYVSFFWGRIRDGSPKVISEKRLKALNDKRIEEFEKLHHQGAEAADLIKSGALTEDDFNPFSVVRRTREFFDRDIDTHSEIITGSMRSIWDVRDAMLAGAHIVTVPYKFFPEMPKLVQHFKTDEVIQQFLSDFENWMK